MIIPDEVPELKNLFCTYGEILSVPRLHKETGMHRCLVRSDYNELLLVELKLVEKEIT